jgi:hypothetical protein
MKKLLALIAILGLTLPVGFGLSACSLFKSKPAEKEQQQQETPDTETPAVLFPFTGEMQRREYFEEGTFRITRTYIYIETDGTWHGAVYLDIYTWDDEEETWKFSREEEMFVRAGLREIIEMSWKEIDNNGVYKYLLTLIAYVVEWHYHYDEDGNEIEEEIITEEMEEEYMGAYFLQDENLYLRSGQLRNGRFFPDAETDEDGNKTYIVVERK